MRVSVILSTHNSPAWLEKALWGYTRQTHRDFEIVVADDGSTPATRELTDEFARSSGLTVLHVWQPHCGFRKCVILNRAIVTASGPYLVFSDGACIPRGDFLEQHVRMARLGSFLSGGVVRLSQGMSRELGQEEIGLGQPFAAGWLLRRTKSLGWNLRKLLCGRRLAKLLDTVTPTQRTFNAHNSSAWHQDLLRINGFDERLQYAGFDRELGERLTNSGVRGKQIRHRAICVQLDQARLYAPEEALAENQKIRDHVRQSGTSWTEYGIRQQLRLYRETGQQPDQIRAAA